MTTTDDAYAREEGGTTEDTAENTLKDALKNNDGNEEYIPKAQINTVDNNINCVLKNNYGNEEYILKVKINTVTRMRLLLNMRNILLKRILHTVPRTELVRIMLNMRNILLKRTL